MTLLSLSDRVRQEPLIADLHVHLLGTGDCDFWAEKLRQLPSSVRLPVESFPLTQMPADPRRLADRGELLSKLLVIDRELWPLEHKEFSKYFRLRQAIAREMPEALSDLVLWNAARYALEGVFYVELSVGAGWLAEDRYARALVDGITRAADEHGVQARLLLGFNRGRVSKEIHNPTFLREMESQLDRKLGPLTEPKFFTEHVQQLEQAVEVADRTGLLRWIVGFDCMGDEKYAPYAPFLLDAFRGVAGDMRRDQPRFGFRLHMGERSFPDEITGYVALRVAHEVIDSLTRSQFPNPGGARPWLGDVGGRGVAAFQRSL